MSKTRWMIVFGPRGKETQFLAHPHKKHTPGWSWSKREAQELATKMGGRVVDAVKWVTNYNRRMKRAVAAQAPKRKTGGRR